MVRRRPRAVASRGRAASPPRRTRRQSRAARAAPRGSPAAAAPDVGAPSEARAARAARRRLPREAETKTRPSPAHSNAVGASTVATSVAAVIRAPDAVATTNPVDATAAPAPPVRSDARRALPREPVSENLLSPSHCDAVDLRAAPVAAAVGAPDTVATALPVAVAGGNGDAVDMSTMAASVAAVVGAPDAVATALPVAVAGGTGDTVDLTTVAASVAAATGASDAVARVPHVDAAGAPPDLMSASSPQHDVQMAEVDCDDIGLALETFEMETEAAPHLANGTSPFNSDQSREGATTSDRISVDLIAVAKAFFCFIETVSQQSLASNVTPLDAHFVAHASLLSQSLCRRLIHAGAILPQRVSALENGFRYPKQTMTRHGGNCCYRALFIALPSACFKALSADPPTPPDDVAVDPPTDHHLRLLRRNRSKQQPDAYLPPDNEEATNDNVSSITAIPPAVDEHPDSKSVDDEDPNSEEEHNDPSRSRDGVILLPGHEQFFDGNPESNDYLVGWHNNQSWHPGTQDLRKRLFEARSRFDEVADEDHRNFWRRFVQSCEGRFIEKHEGLWVVCTTSRATTLMQKRARQMDTTKPFKEGTGKHPAKDDKLIAKKDISDKDAVFMQGKGWRDHPGYVTFRSFCSEYVGQYAAARTNNQRLREIKAGIFQRFKDAGGRIVSWVKQNKYFYEVHGNYAFVKIGVTLNQMNDKVKSSKSGVATPAIALLAIAIGFVAQTFINSMLKGDRGLGAFLSDGSEFSDSAFRPRRGGDRSDTTTDAPLSGPDPLPWLKLPQFDFVEVAGQETRKGARRGRVEGGKPGGTAGGAEGHGLPYRRDAARAEGGDEPALRRPRRRRQQRRRRRRWRRGSLRRGSVRGTGARSRRGRSTGPTAARERAGKGGEREARSPEEGSSGASSAVGSDKECQGNALSSALPARKRKATFDLLSVVVGGGGGHTLSNIEEEVGLRPALVFGQRKRRRQGGQGRHARGAEMGGSKRAALACASGTQRRKARDKQESRRGTKGWRSLRRSLSVYGSNEEHKSEVKGLEIIAPAEAEADDEFGFGAIEEPEQAPDPEADGGAGEKEAGAETAAPRATKGASPAKATNANEDGNKENGARPWSAIVAAEVTTAPSEEEAPQGAEEKSAATRASSGAT
ncbi:hypothetical protein ACHAWF_014681, partial [Thalassiosira exigua]